MTDLEKQFDEKYLTDGSYWFNKNGAKSIKAFISENYLPKTKVLEAIEKLETKRTAPCECGGGFVFFPTFDGSKPKSEPCPQCGSTGRRPMTVKDFRADLRALKESLNL